MNDLVKNFKEMVFREQNIHSEPYTTAQIIAEYTGTKQSAIERLIRDHKKDFEYFGIFGFEIRKIPGRGRPQKVYKLNEQQATLLITYLRNTDQVRAFKKELVRQFYDMKQELSKCREYRCQLKPTSKTLAEAVKENTPPEHLHTYTYSNFFSLVHKIALGKSTAQLKKERGIPQGANIPDYLTADELERVYKADSAIVAMLGLGMDYQSIKSALVKPSVSS